MFKELSVNRDVRHFLIGLRYLAIGLALTCLVGYLAGCLYEHIEIYIPESMRATPTDWGSPYKEIGVGLYLVAGLVVSSMVAMLALAIFIQMIVLLGSPSEKDEKVQK